MPLALMGERTGGLHPYQFTQFFYPFRSRKPSAQIAPRCFSSLRVSRASTPAERRPFNRNASAASHASSPFNAISPSARSGRTVEHNQNNFLANLEARAMIPRSSAAGPWWGWRACARRRWSWGKLQSHGAERVDSIRLRSIRALPGARQDRETVTAASRREWRRKSLERLDSRPETAPSLLRVTSRKSGVRI